MDKIKEYKYLLSSIQEKEEENTKIQENVQTLEAKLTTENELKLKTQKEASKKEGDKFHESYQVQKLNEEVLLLENENKCLQEQLQKFLQEYQIKYSDDVREVFYNLLSKGVAIRNNWNND